MSIRYAILGFLGWRPFTGYELKKRFADELSFHWSGNNNQIYGSLLELHREGAVSVEVQQQEKLPARKVYAITPKGREELRAWLLSEPELPLLRAMAHAQLAWAEGLSAPELEALAASYERQLSDQALMCRESIRRGRAAPERSPREALIWRMVEERHAAFYEEELAWLRSLRAALAGLEGGAAAGPVPGA